MVYDGLWIWLHHQKNLMVHRTKIPIISLWIWVTFILISSKKYLSFAVALTPIVHQYRRMLPQLELMAPVAISPTLKNLVLALLHSAFMEAHHVFFVLQLE